MSLILTGDPTHVTTPLTATITALANNGSGAVRVTTGAPHLFGSQDSVIVTTPVLTGQFTITAIDSTHFDLQGSTFTSTSTGTAKDLSLTPQILVPTDGDTFSQQLSGALSALQALCDRTQALQGRFVAQSQTVTATGTTTITIPPNCAMIDVDACGGGGGGGSGAGGGMTAGSGAVGVTGGSGGAGAKRRRVLINVTPGAQYDVIIGGGGAGGAGVAGGGGNVTPGNPGSDGNPTYIQPHGGGTILNFWEGGKAGCGGSTSTSDVATPTSWTLSPGAQGPASGTINPLQSYTFNVSTSLPGDTTQFTQPLLFGPWPAGTGGLSVHGGGTTVGSAAGAGIAQEHGGGGFGAVGANTGSGATLRYGGSGGGGGGGACFLGTNFLPNPQAGGDGGSGNSGGPGVNGNNGNDAEHNTGGGGGGGGGGGQGSSTVGGAGGAGGKGGSGNAIVYFIPGL